MKYLIANYQLNISLKPMNISLKPMNISLKSLACHLKSLKFNDFNEILTDSMKYIIANYQLNISLNQLIFFSVQQSRKIHITNN